MARPLVALLLVVTSCAAYAEEQVPLYREIKDWVVACDNIRSCTAIGAVPMRDDTGARLTFSLRIIREAGPTGVLRVGMFSYNPATGKPLLDGKPLRTSLAAGELKEGDVPEVLSAAGDQARALIAELRNGNELTLPTQDGQSFVSLAGMSAALLLMDSVQGRVGTVTALVRQGAASASTVTPAPPRPTLPPWYPPVALTPPQAQHIRDVVMATTRASWQQDQLDDTPAEGEAFALSDRQALVIIKTDCAAYNCSYRLYETPIGHPEQARPARIDAVPRMPDMLPNGSIRFDPASGELSSHELAMGMGGCGTSLRWQYDGSAFRLTRAAQLTLCVGLNEAYWPVLWRSPALLAAVGPAHVE
ncbi:Protein of unknown function (DUF1176) [Pseudomonas asplenii]|uniref:DUF1176 domain-containing protein n=1 Tax=Pseudomonas asplenii TaxID=53407 RepID=A0A0M9GHB4_9PSED|nr:DUF1176 domain-containing protein [Pseudomonas fuscovaginae]KPA91251.1 Protein of unknown function (DUF1176) [Pseudomonas fuscovaginae]